MLQKLARHDRDVISARQMLGGVRRIVEAGAVDKMRVLHPKLGRARVHSLDKRRLTPGDMLGKRRRAVVGRADDHAFEHLIHAHLLADLQINLTAALCRRGL